MRSFSLVLLVGLSALGTVLAVGQYYVPRAYYTIDQEGHVSAPVPLRRLRRSLHTAPQHSYGGNGASASADASASSDSFGGGDGGSDSSASARASSSSSSGSGNWYPGGGAYYPGAWGGGHRGHGHGYGHPVLGYH